MASMMNCIAPGLMRPRVSKNEKCGPCDDQGYSSMYFCLVEATKPEPPCFRGALSFHAAVPPESHVSVGEALPSSMFPLLISSCCLLHSLACRCKPWLNGWNGAEEEMDIFIQYNDNKTVIVPVC
jgi:hypothetical protein